MHKNIIQKGLLFFLAFAMIFAGCVTRKKKGNVSKTAKLYHNITAHYNGYFNAELLYDESLEILNQQHREDFSEILPLYPYTEAENIGVVKPKLEEAIKKVSVVVNLHRPSDWTDDCYLMFGKCEYLKQDYESAQKVLEYTVREYSPSKLILLNKKSRKKGKSLAKQKNKELKKRKKELKKERKRKERERRKERKSKSRLSDKEKREIARKRYLESKREEAQDSVKRASPETNNNTSSGSIADRSKRGGVEKEDEVHGMFGHDIAYPEALLWLAKTYIERDRFASAYQNLKKIEVTPETTREVLREVPVVWAYYFLKQEKYEQAIPHLNEAAELSKDREDKARYTYIRGQLYRKKDNPQAALEAFQKVVSYKPSYAFTFNALLNTHLLTLENDPGKSGEVKKELEKMLKDDKNLEYHDQVYYTLGQMSIEHEQYDEALDYFQKSLKESTGNSTQKVLTYRALADLYFHHGDFVASKNYYDSTLAVLNKNDKDYLHLSKLRDNLTDIAERITAISELDTLLQATTWTERQRLLWAERQHDKNKSPVSKAPPSPIRDKKEQTTGAVSPGEVAVLRKSNFFAYNPHSVQEGIRQFERTWRDRPPSNYWFLNSMASTEVVIDSVIEEEEVIPEHLADNPDLKVYLDQIPSTPDAIGRTKNRLATAMFELGSLYRDKLEMYDRSLKVHETFLDEFPNDIRRPKTYFYLYLNHRDLANFERVEYYKAKLLNDYPASIYSQAINNPDFIAEQKDKEAEYSEAYDEARQLFDEENYEDLRAHVNATNNTWPQKYPYRAKMILLDAMARGALEGREAYIEGLKDVVSQHPETDEATRAKEIMRFLKGDEGAFAGNEDDQEKYPFTMEEDKLHYVMVVLRNPDVISINQAKVAASNYNKKYYKLDKLQESHYTLSMEDNLPIILIRKFQNADRASRYVDQVAKNKGDFMPQQAVYDIYPVSQKNYRELLKARSLAGYPSFVKKNY